MPGRHNMSHAWQPKHLAQRGHEAHLDSTSGLIVFFFLHFFNLVFVLFFKIVTFNI